MNIYLPDRRTGMGGQESCLTPAEHDVLCLGQYLGTRVRSTHTLVRRLARAAYSTRTPTTTPHHNIRPTTKPHGKCRQQDGKLPSSSHRLKTINSHKCQYLLAIPSPSKEPQPFWMEQHSAASMIDRGGITLGTHCLTSVSQDHHYQISPAFSRIP